MNVIVIDGEADSLLTFASHAIDEVNVSLKLFRKNVNDALNYAKTNDCKAVFLDIVMPTVNGVDLAERFIEICPDIKIVFITGYAQDIESIKTRIGKNFYGYCYKPYDSATIKAILTSLVNEGKNVKFKALSHFDYFIGNSAVDFPRAKSKELLALLVDRRGAIISMEEAVSYLWKDKPADLAKKLYRDAVCRLRLVLKNLGAEKILDVKRARISLVTEFCECDAWDLFDGKQGAAFGGEYMRPYEWAIEKEAALCNQYKHAATE